MRSTPRTRSSVPRSARSVAITSIGSLAFLGACCPCALGVAPAQTASSAAPLAAGTAAASASVPYTWKNVKILGGGFVTGVIFSEAEKNLVYARTDIGGAYRYDPQGKSWVPLIDFLSKTQGNFYGVESIAPDPSDPERVYLAVGTYTQDWASNGAILRSSDRGKTWQVADMSFKMGGNENGRGNGERMAVDPNLNQNILFGSRKNGLWKSVDSGASWSAQDFPVSTEPLGVGITFVLFDKQSGTKGKPTPRLYAGFASKDVGLYASENGGKDWKPLAGQPKGVMPSHAGIDRDGMLYLSYADQPGPSDVRNGAIWKYNQKTRAWTNITPLAPKGEDTFGYGGLSVLATSSGTLMATTIDRWGPGDQVFRSTNGGKSWKSANEHATFDAAGARYLHWGRDKPSNSGWMADVDIDPFDPAHALYVTGQGIWGSDDASATDEGKASHWSFRNLGLEETAVLDFASPPSGPQLYSGLGDICGFRHDDLDQAPPDGMFENPIFGNVESLDFAELHPEVVVRVGNHDKTPGAISSDGGKTWTPLASAPKGKGRGAVVIAPDASRILWVPKAGLAAVSSDRGATFKTSAGLPEPATLPEWASVNLKPAADRVNPKKFYIYDAVGGRAYYSEDGAATFSAAGTALPVLPEYNLGVATIVAVPGVEGDVWITTNQALYHSLDSGKSYVAMAGAVQESYGLGLGKPAKDGNYPALYLAGKVNDTVGYFRSEDRAETWVRINDDAHQFGGAGLVAGDPRVYGRVYIGTNGRGIIYGDPQ